MLKMILLILAFASTANAIRTPEDCIEAIKKQYNRGMVRIYSIEPRHIGRGRYATHFYYEIKYVRHWEKRYTQEGCVEKVYCASYDDTVYVDTKYCGRD